jgi:superfamily II DNA or RNA helicase
LYHDVVLGLHQQRIPYVDEARQYVLLDRPLLSSRQARSYQKEAVDAWRTAGRRGVVVLPTGSGKSFVAELCIESANRSALVVVPTIDLLGQWYDGMMRTFGGPVGILGGGHHEVCDITVATYDSAWMHMERYGNRFGLIVFDEVHHLPGPSYSEAARACIAPFRLGLTATLERPDGAHHALDNLLGQVVYRKEITELAGDFLADYQTHVLTVHLSEEERLRYEEARQTYREFVDEQGIRMGGPGGWQQFLRASSRSKKGREAFGCWRESRRIVQGSAAKVRLLVELLNTHRSGRVIVFTNDNATVYEISRSLLIPAITHQTDAKERRLILANFEAGIWPVIATSRVLNEGVDMPGADVAIVLSGSNTVREHVQRLGRILRPQAGKRAVLYELVVADSLEERSSARRREHVAYKSAPELG